MLFSQPKCFRVAVLLAASIIATAQLTVPHAQAQPAPDAPAPAAEAPGSATPNLSNLEWEPAPLSSGAAPEFYQPPSQIPAIPGTILRSQQAPQLLNLADPIAHELGLRAPEWPGQTHRIMYSSTDAHGDPVAITGVVLEPANKWAGPGPTPTVVMAAGTRGQGDACAPSKGPWLLGELDREHGALGVNYELPVMYAASLAGMRVIMTDYIGLGTPGMHHYVHRIEQAQAVIDSARAGLALDGAPADSPIAFYGYSQGGGAAAAAAEVVADYAPELNVVATYAGAPPADLFSVLHAVDSSSIAGVMGYAMNTAQDLDDSVKEAVRRNAEEPQIAEIGRLSDACIPDTVARWAFQDSASLIGGEKSLQQIIDAEPAIREYLKEQALGVHPITGPMLVLSHPEDDIIPHDQARAMAIGYCKLGATVDFRDPNLPGVLPKSGANHALAVATHSLPALQWVRERFAGKPAPNSCADLTSGAEERILGSSEGTGLLSSAAPY